MKEKKTKPYFICMLMVAQFKLKRKLPVAGAFGLFAWYDVCVYYGRTVKRENEARKQASKKICKTKLIVGRKSLLCLCVCHTVFFFPIKYGSR